MSWRPVHQKSRKKGRASWCFLSTDLGDAPDHLPAFETQSSKGQKLKSIDGFQANKAATGSIH
jgi:hypothetical protein